MNKKYKNQKGFTLVETIITIFIFSIVMGGVTLILKNIIVNSTQQTKVTDNIYLAEKITNTFTNEIRNSTYGINGAYPIGKADNTEIIFYSTAIKKDGTVSKIRYYVTSGILYKGVTQPTGNPLAYTTETITTLMPVSLGSNPLFYYYDGTYNGTGTPLVQTININSVKFVKMNLIVLKQDVRNSTNTFTVSSGGAIRNLKNNLGN